MAVIVGKKVKRTYFSDELGKTFEELKAKDEAEAKQRAEIAESEQSESIMVESEKAEEHSSEQPVEPVVPKKSKRTPRRTPKKQ